MAHGRKKPVWLPVLFLVWALPSTVYPVESGIDQATLRGIKAVYVSVEGLTPGIQTAGLSAEQIREDMESRLRTKGIRILKRDKWLRSRGAPWLRVDVNVVRMENIHAYRANISIRCLQAVRLVRDPNIITVTATWSKEGLASVSRLDDIREFIKISIDEFLDAYSSVNKK